MKFSALLFSILIYFCGSAFQDDLEKVKSYYSCDPSCTFNHSEITSETVKFFPKCAEVCGILTINENTDLPEPQMKKVFENMHTLFGGINILNSGVRSLSFFNTDNEYGEFNFFCDTYGFFIRNNFNLTDISVLNEFYVWNDDDYKECEVRIEGNRKLYAYSLKKNPVKNTYIDVRASGNLRDCGCRGDDLTDSVSSSYATCEYLFGGLKITSELSGIGNLGRIRFVKGHFWIQNTDWKDLSVFEILWEVQIKNIGLTDEIFVNIQNNTKMTRLNLPWFLGIQYDWHGNRFVNLENLHPEFCMNAQEILAFLKSNVFFTHLHAKFCEKFGVAGFSNMCTFESMKGLEQGCEHIFGALSIGDGDEKYVKKLKNVTALFGRLRIENSSLVDLDFLAGLKYIANLDESQPAIQIRNNRYLSNAFLPGIENIIIKGKQFVEIENNDSKLFNSSEFFKLFNATRFGAKSKYLDEKYLRNR